MNAVFPTFFRREEEGPAADMAQQKVALPVDPATVRAYHPSELPQRVLDAMEKSKMGPEYDYLNALLDD